MATTCSLSNLKYLSIYIFLLWVTVKIKIDLKQLIRSKHFLVLIDFKDTYRHVGIMDVSLQMSIPQPIIVTIL